MPALSAHAIAVLALTGTAFVLLALPRASIPAVSIAVLFALPLLFVLFPLQVDGAALDPRVFFHGFGHDALVAICALLILGLALERTGALRPLVKLLAGVFRRSQFLGLLAILLTALTISGVVNDTPVVVLLMPVLVAVAAETGSSSARTLMPMNLAVLIGGMATAIGTSTNLLVVSIAADIGMPPIGIFEWTPLVAIAALAVALPYLLFVAPLLLPKRRGAERQPVERVYDATLYVPEESPVIGETLGALLERSGQQLRVQEVRRGAHSLMRLPTLQIAAGDRLVVSDTAARLKTWEEDFGLTLYNADDDERPVDAEHPLTARDSRVVEVVVLPGSPAAGNTVRSLRVFERYDMLLLGIYRPRRRTTLRDDVADVVLQTGDVLLMQGREEGVEALRASHGVVVVDGGISGQGTRRGRIALVIMAAVVALAVFKVLPMYLAAVGGVVAMLATRCLRVDDIADALKLDVILLIAASLALARAMMDTGAVAAIADMFAAMVGGWPPIAIVGALLVFVGLLTNFVSNNGAAAIGTPLAIELARRLGLAEMPFVLAIVFGCNLSYVTPFAYQTNLLIMSVARYTFVDFVKVGGPLFVLMAAALTGILGWRYDMF